MIIKTICILANSVKNGQSCIAGVEVLKNSNDGWKNLRNWIRPISHRSNGAISDRESYLNNMRRVPRLFDIVEVPLDAPAHVEGQPEDWLISEGKDWHCQGTFNPEKAAQSFVESPMDLWSEVGEKNDRVTPEFVAQRNLPSLYFVKPEELVVYISESDYGAGPKRTRRSHFKYQGNHYDFGMTDKIISNKYFPDIRSFPAGISSGVPIESHGICVSLAPSWKGDFLPQAYHYKLLAAIVESK